MYYIYILYSVSSNKYYVGYTSNVLQRVAMHNTSQQNTFTAKHRPWEIKAVFGVCENEGEAMKIEKFIKKQKSRKLLERMIAGENMTGILANLMKLQTPDG